MKTHKYLFLLPFLLLFASCGVYRTQMVDIPLMGEKGELQLSGSFSSLLHDPAVSATATYAVTDHMAVQGYFLSSRVRTTDAFPFNVQGAIGYYTPVKNSRAIFELYAGVNAGWRNWEYSNILDGRNENFAYWADNGETVELYHTAIAQTQYYFLQANYGWCVNDRFEWGFALKGGVMNIYQDLYDDYISNSIIDENGFEQVYQVQTLTTYNIFDSRRLIEPQIFFRWGKNHIKYHFQMGCSLFDQRPSIIDIDPISMGFGISYRF